MGVSEAEFVGYFDKLSNWRRWGDSDRFGTLNFVTHEVRLAAVSLVATAETVSCGRPIHTGTAGPDGMSPLHFMRRTGNQLPNEGSGSIIDWLGIALHGPVTHVDAFSHFSWNGVMYNGRPSTELVTGAGAREGDVTPLRNGIVTRGVLLDIPRSRGVEALDPGAAVTVTDLDACADMQGTEIRPGDALLVRTGRDRLPPQSTWTGTDPKAGLDVETLPWLHEHQIAILGSDRDSDCRPHRYASIPSPIHVVALVAMGLWLLDNAFLETLAEHCAARGRYEFLFTFAPLELVGATGCPVNPIAIF